MSGVGLGTTLVVVWALLWGSFSPANLLSGVIVVALVFWLIPDVRFSLRRPTIRPLATLRLLGAVTVAMLRANAVLTREIVSRGSRIHTGVVAVPLPLCSDGLLTVVANVLALTPGTMPVEVTRNPPAIYVHVLHLHDVDRVRTDVQALAGQVVAAFGTVEAVAALARPDHPGDGDPA